MNTTIITQNEVKKVAHLARLEEDQAEKYLSSLQTILTFIAHINDNAEIETLHTGSTTEASLFLRKDEIVAKDDRDKLLALAKRSESGLYLVPQVIE